MLVQVYGIEGVLHGIPGRQMLRVSLVSEKAMTL